MGLSPCKMGNREFESDYHHRPHFFGIQLFQTKYLGEYLSAVSLSLCIFEGRVDSISNIIIRRFGLDVASPDNLAKIDL